MNIGLKNLINYQKMSSYSTVQQSYRTDEDEENVKLVLDIDTEESFERIIRMFPIVVVDVYANFCNPCRMLAPKYEKLAKKYNDLFLERKIIFLKDNIEENEDIHKPLVTVIPTFFIYIRGQRHHVQSFSNLDNVIQDALSLIEH